MPDGVGLKVSAWTFQQGDGSNFTTAGAEVLKKFGNANLSVYGGVGTTFEQGKTGAVVDLKGSIPYGDSIFSASFRVRNNINPASQSVQLRVQPCNVDVPLGENTTIYADPYVAVKTDYATGQTTPSVGCFAGVKQKIGDNVVGFVEGQVYDPTNINLETVSVNVGISYSF